MLSLDIDEAVEVGGRILGEFVRVAARHGLSAAPARREALSAIAGLEEGIRGGTLGDRLRGLFGLATAAGFMAAEYEVIYRAASVERPQSEVGQRIVAGIVRLTLIAGARHVVSLTFTSRDEVEAVRIRVRTAFDAATEVAADNHRVDVMDDLIGLGAAVQRHLSETARPLPRVVRYDIPTALPSLTLAHRIYADGSRHNELELENRARHPLFMPSSGRALSA